MPVYRCPMCLTRHNFETVNPICPKATCATPLIATAGPTQIGDDCFFLPPTPGHNEIITATYLDFLFGGFLGADFQIHALVNGVNIRYRQLIKGFFKIDDVIQGHDLTSGPLDQHVFQEDSNGNGFYGRRDQNITGLSVYAPITDINGITVYNFKAEDTPGEQGIAASEGSKFEVNLTFKGQLTDVGDPTVATVYRERIWHVRGTYTKPET